MIQEDYVSFELAKQLKEKGFPQMGLESYHYVEETKTFYNEQIYRPTLSLVQKWLREEKEIHIDILSDTDYPEWTGEFYYSYDLSYHSANRVQTWEHDGFKTYEEALEAAINKALELIMC